MFNTLFLWQPAAAAYLTYICAVCTQTHASHLLLSRRTAARGHCEWRFNEFIRHCWNKQRRQEPLSRFLGKNLSMSCVNKGCESHRDRQPSGVYSRHCQHMRIFSWICWYVLWKEMRPSALVRCFVWWLTVRSLCDTVHRLASRPVQRITQNDSVQIKLKRSEVRPSGFVTVEDRVTRLTSLLKAGEDPHRWHMQEGRSPRGSSAAQLKIMEDARVMKLTV